MVLKSSFQTLFKSPFKRLLSGDSPRWQSQRSIPLLLVGSMIVAVSTTAVTSYWIVRSLILSTLKDEAELQVQLSAHEIDQWLATLQAQVDSIANRSTIRSMDWSLIEPSLQLELDRLPDIHMFVVARPDGSYYTTRNGFVKDRNLSDRRHFQKAMAGETFVDDPVVSRSTGIRQVNIAAPIWSLPPLNRSSLTPEQAQLRSQSLVALDLPGDLSTPPQPIGELAAPVALERIAQVVEKTESGQGSYAFALDSQGIPIAHPNKQVLDQAESFLKSADPALVAIAQAMKQKRKGIELLQIQGDWVYVAYVHLNQADWSLALVIPRGNLEQQLNALNLLAFVLGSLLLLATLIAIRQIGLFEQTRARAAQEELLNRLTGRIRESLDLQTILQTTVYEVATLLHLDRVTFSWYHPERQVLEMLCEYHEEHLASHVGCYDLRDFGDLEKHLASGDWVKLDSVAAVYGDQPEVRKAYLQLGAASYLALPVLIQENQSGYLICARSFSYRWNDREIELLKAVAAQLAIALTQAQLHAQTEQQVQTVSAQARCLTETLTKLQSTQAQLIQTEKMSSLGQLVAGVAHEINNPVNFIYGNLSYAGEYTQNLLNLIQLYQEHYPDPPAEIQNEIVESELDYIIEDLPKLLISMKIGADRIRQIVLSLRNFSRLDEAEMKPANIHDGIDSTLLILQNRLKSKSNQAGIQIVKEYGDLPLVECYPGQLNQVLMNILSNAIDALEKSGADSEAPAAPETADLPHSSGLETNSVRASTHPDSTITIRTQVLPDRSHIAIRIHDNGPGIPPEHQAKLFDPFFTTKPVGQGTGLGLSISYQIVAEKHRGSLKCISEPGQGTEFWLEIPISQSPAQKRKEPQPVEVDPTPVLDGQPSESLH